MLMDTKTSWTLYVDNPHLEEFKKAKGIVHPNMKFLSCCSKPVCMNTKKKFWRILVIKQLIWLNHHFLQLLKSMGYTTKRLVGHQQSLKYHLLCSTEQNLYRFGTTW